MAERQDLLDSAYDALDAHNSSTKNDNATPQPSQQRPESVSTPFGEDDNATEDLERMSFLSPPPATPHAPPPAGAPPVPPPPTPPSAGDGGGGSPAGRLFHNLQNQVAATQNLLFSGGSGRDDAEVNNHVMGGETPQNAVSAPIGTGASNNNHAGGGAGDEDEASTTSSATSTSGASGSRRTRKKNRGNKKSTGSGGQQQQQQPSVTITNYGTSSTTTTSSGYQSSVAGTVNTPGKSNLPGASVTQLVFRLRILNILLCTATLTVQILGLVQKIFDVTKLVLASYVMFFALLLCCYEMHIPQFVAFLRDNFGILYTPAGRASFLILLGSTCLTQDFVTFVLGLVLIADGIFTFWVMYRYPEFRRVEEEVGREDATSLLAERVGIARPPAWATPAGATAGDYGATGSGAAAAKGAGTGSGGEMLYDGTYSIAGRGEGGAVAPILDFAQKKNVPWNGCWPGKDDKGGA